MTEKIIYIKRNFLFRCSELYIKILEANNDKLPYNLTLSDVSKMKELDIYEWYAYNKAISKEMLENAFEYILPFRLGIIRIKKYKAHYKVDEETGKIMKKLNQKKNWFIILMSILMAISISGISVITVLIVLISQHIALFLLGLIKEN